VVSDDDISDWVDRLRKGDNRAAQAVWECYFDKLVALSRQKLAAFPRRAVDEEDVALSALKSFCRGAASDRFPKLDDRHDLWKVLVTITARKVVAQRRRYFSQKRGGGKVRGESVFLPHAAEHEEGRDGIDQVLGREPTPEVAAMLAEQCSGLLGQLDDRQKPIALLKMEGFTNQEIAEQLDVALRTVERRLDQIRQAWSAESAPP
jgi:DNA-directed RNA polymerase specialized sigma24 family protein